MKTRGYEKEREREWEREREKGSIIVCPVFSFQALVTKPKQPKKLSPRYGTMAGETKTITGATATTATSGTKAV